MAGESAAASAQGSLGWTGYETPNPSCSAHGFWVMHEAAAQGKVSCLAVQSALFSDYWADPTVCFLFLCRVSLFLSALVSCKAL